MPNWCENQIEIKGKKETIIELVEFTKGKESDFDFEKVVPHPRGMKRDSEEGSEFRIANWGTKWKLESDSVWIEIEELGEVAKIDFSTAWGPSLGITLALSKKFPSLQFRHRFAESGMDFSGYTIFSGGVETETKEGEYSAYQWTEDDKDIVGKNDDVEVVEAEKVEAKEDEAAIQHEIPDDHSMFNLSLVSVEISEGILKIGKSAFACC